MNRKAINDDLGDVSEAELDRLERLLDNWQTPQASPDEIERTIAAASLELRLRATPAESWAQRMLRLLRLVAGELPFMSRSFWVASLLLYVVGLLSLMQLQQTPQLALFALAPVPMLLGLGEALRSRDAGMLELEMSCRYNGASVMLAKLSIAGVYTVALNSAASLWLSGTGTGIRLGELTLVWLTPFTLATAVALAVIMRMRGSQAVLLTLAVWAMCCLLLLLSPELGRWINRLTGDLGMVMAALGGCAALWQGWRVTQRLSTERGADWLETDD
ncbi:hypothetical protein PA598K_03344 [Paenibacillus sp. 598K]|uniref:hypothetical protein n=1 Tax=Paenibacillus sp. 598K TaxID=1117987 RepID=UPI000FF9D58A|nr:hypothetical protein [Paenibacillus sp. 598K]GBF74971.1 hypothetical protein PA598K_03344 [Paenibacillus sp. 598K]